MLRALIIFLSLMFSVSILAHDHEDKDCHKSEHASQLEQDNSWISTSTALKLGGAAGVLVGGYTFYKTQSVLLAVTVPVVFVPLAGYFLFFCHCGGLPKLELCHLSPWKAIQIGTIFGGVITTCAVYLNVQTEFNKHKTCCSGAHQ